jgi:hypothetical protein
MIAALPSVDDRRTPRSEPSALVSQVGAVTVGRSALFPLSPSSDRTGFAATSVSGKLFVDMAVRESPTGITGES